MTEPRIYFGQSASGYVIVKGSTPEFDYPKGKRQRLRAVTTARTAFPIGGIAWRTLFAWYFDDVNILLSGYITGESRIMLHRNIQDRVRTIAPFLQLDRDPYVVISGGRLYWMQDAYTTSDWFPYAQPQPDGGDLNYIRNSVKVVIDAYNGTVDVLCGRRQPIRSSRPTAESSPRCSSRWMRCRRICKSTSATPRTCSISRLCSTARITWTRLKCSTIARISGSFRASRPPRTAIERRRRKPDGAVLHHDAPAR